MARDSPRYTGVGTGRRQGERCHEEEARAAPESLRLTATEKKLMPFLLAGGEREAERDAAPEPEPVCVSLFPAGCEHSSPSCSSILPLQSSIGPVPIGAPCPTRGCRSWEAHYSPHCTCGEISYSGCGEPMGKP